MARVQKDTVQLTIELNGRQVKNTIQSLNKEYKNLNREIKELTPGTDEFISKAKELAKAEKALKDARGAARAFREETKESTSVMSRLGGIAKGIGGAIAGAFALDAVKNFLGRLTSSAIELEAFQAKSKVVFGSAIFDVEEFARRNAAALGLTEQEYVTAAAAAGDLLIPMGFQREEAASLSNDLIGLSGALAEWSGGQKDAKEVSDILTKALLGEREQLKTLGISILEADVQQRLLENGHKKLTGQALEQAKATATLQLITEKSADAQAQFAANSNSLQRRFARLKAVGSNLWESFSNSAIPVLGKAAGVLENLLGVSTGYSGQLEEQRVALNVLLGQIQETNEGEALRVELIDKLQQQYPDFLGNLDAEKVTNEQLALRLSEVNEQMINRIIIQQEQEKIEEQAAKAAERARTAAKRDIEARTELVRFVEEYNLEVDQSVSLTEKYTQASEQLYARIRRAQSQGAPAEQVRLLTNRYLEVRDAIEGVENSERKSAQATEKLNVLTAERQALMNKLGISSEVLSKAENENASTTKNRSGKYKELTAEQKKQIKEQEKIAELEQKLAFETEKLKIEATREGADKRIALLKLEADERLRQLNRSSQGADKQIVAAQERELRRELEQQITQIRIEASEERIEEISKNSQQEIALVQGTEQEKLRQRITIERQALSQIREIIQERRDFRINQERLTAIAEVSALDETASEYSERKASIEEASQQRLTQIEQRYQVEQRAAFQQFEESKISAKEAAFQREIQLLEQQQQQRILTATVSVAQEAEEGLIDPVDVERVIQERIKALRIQFLQEKIQLERAYGEDTIETQQEIEDTKLEQAKERISEEERLEQEKNDRLAESARSVTDIASSLNSIQQAGTDKQIREIERKKDAEVNAAGQSATARAAAEKKYDQQVQALKEKQAKANKRIAIGQAVVDGALAIQRIAADVPKGDFGISTALLIGAQIARTGAQVAAITAAPLAIGGPTTAANLAKAGTATVTTSNFYSNVSDSVSNMFYEGQAVTTKPSFSSGGAVGSPTLALVGERGPEWVAPNWMMSHPIWGAQISNLENVRVRGYASGGFTSSTTAGPTDQAIQAASLNGIADILDARFQSLERAYREQPAPVIPVDDELADLVGGRYARLNARRSKGKIS